MPQKKNVYIRYNVTDFNSIRYPKNKFDCIAIIYFHLPSEQRSRFHIKMLSLLKPDGILILEGFSMNQINRNSGGPRNSNMLFSKEELQADFSLASGYNIVETEVNLNEGRYHQGISSIIRLIAYK